MRKVPHLGARFDGDGPVLVHRTTNGFEEVGGNFAGLASSRVADGDHVDADFSPGG